MRMALAHADRRWGQTRYAPMMMSALLATATTSGCFFDLGRSAELEPGDVGGTAVRPNGNATAFAQIGIEGIPLQTGAAADGRFVVKDVPAGTWRLNAKDDTNGDGWPERAAVVGFRIINTDNTNGFFGETESRRSSVDLGDVVLEGTVRLEGEVEDDTGAAASDARVVVVYDSVPVSGLDGVTVDSIGAIESRVAVGSDGRFLVPGVAAGTFFVVAYAERGTDFLVSPPREVTQFSGSATLVGEERLVIENSSAERDIGFTVSPAPDAGAAIRLQLRRAGVGADVAVEERTAVLDGEVWTVADVPLGPWTMQIVVDGRLSSLLESRFILPGAGRQDLGAFAVAEEGCSDCDCDRDGVRGLPQPPSVADRNLTCDGTVAAARTIWDECLARCVSGVSVCFVNDVAYDCEDDLDGQADVFEPACYGIEKGGADCDGDGICEVFDSDDRCAEGTECELEDAIGRCLGSAVDEEVDGGVEPEDGGPGAIDAGPVDAGPTDAGPGPVDAGPADAGPSDAGADAGPADAGPADAGVDAGPADAGPADAGPTVILPPPSTGDALSEPYDTLPLSGIQALFFSGSVVRFSASTDFPDPELPACTDAFVPTGTVTRFFAKYSDSGECDWITGVEGAPGDDDSLDAMVAAPDGGLFVALSIGPTATFGVDLNGDPVTTTSTNGLALVHYGPDGRVVTHRVVEFPGGTFPLETEMTSHPLAQGPVLFVGILNELATELTIDGLTQSTPSDAMVAVFFDDTFTATSLQVLGEAAVEIFFPAQPSATRVTLGAFSEGLLFPGTAQAVAAEAGVFIEIGPAGPRWSRRVLGLNGEATIGVDVVTEDVFLGFDTRVIPDAVVMSSSAGTVEVERGTNVTRTLDAIPVDVPSIAVRSETGAIVFVNNNANPPGIFEWDRGAPTPRRLVTSAGSEAYASVRPAPNGQIVYLTTFSDLYVTRPNGPAVLIESGVEPSFAVDHNENEVFFINSSAVRRSSLIGEPFPFPTGLSIENGLLAHDGDSLVWYTEAGGNGEFRIVETLNIFAPAPFLTVPPLVGATGLEYDREEGTLWLTADAAVEFAAGVVPNVAPGSVTFAPFGGPTGITASARQVGQQAGLVRGDDSIDSIVGDALVHILALDEMGEIKEQYDVGFGSGDFSIDVLSIRGDAMVIAGEVSNTVRFEAVGETPLALSGADLAAADTSQNDEFGVVHFRLLAGEELLADWVQQSESPQFVNANFTAFADTSVAVHTSAPSEVRLGTHVLGNQNSVLWRIGSDGGERVNPPSADPVIDTGRPGGGFDPVDLFGTDGATVLLDDGYITETNLPGDVPVGTVFGGTPCEFTPDLNPGRAVIKRSFDGSCQWLRAYSGADLNVDVIRANVGNHVVIAVAAGIDEVREFNSLTGATTTRIAQGVAVTHIADDGGTISGFEVATIDSGSQPVVAVALPTGEYGAFLNTIGNATAFVGTASEVEVTTQTPGFLHAVIAIADFAGAGLLTRSIAGETSINVLAMTGVGDGSVIGMLDANAPDGVTLLDGAVVVPAGESREVLFRLVLDVPQGTVDWVGTTSGGIFLRQIAVSPGGTEFAVSTIYSNDLGSLDAVLAGTTLDVLPSPSEANAVIVGAVDSGALLMNMTLEGSSSARSITMPAAGQVSLALSTGGEEDTVIHEFFPTNQVVGTEPGVPTNRSSVWKFATDLAGGLGYAGVEHFESAARPDTFKVISVPYREERAVLQGDTSFNEAGSEAIETPTTAASNALLWRVRPSGVVKAPTLEEFNNP